METFLYNFNFWVYIRRGTLPLTTSRRCLPVLASLWNRSKNGSDVATGIMRSIWYSLPTQSRNPPALVVQRIMFLITINIMKIATFLSFKKKDGRFEEIDHFRNRSNKIYGSHRAFLLHVRKKCIVPMLEREIARTKSLHNALVRDNCEYINTPAQPTTRNREIVHERRETRSGSKTKNIKEINSCFLITETTPNGRNRDPSKNELRVLKPLFGNCKRERKKVYSLQ